MALLLLCGSTLALPFFACHGTALAVGMTATAHCAGMLPHNDTHAANHGSVSQHAAAPMQATADAPPTSDCGFLCEAYCSASNAVEPPTSPTATALFAHAWAAPGITPTAPIRPPDALFRPPAQG